MKQRAAAAWQRIRLSPREREGLSILCTSGLTRGAKGGREKQPAEIPQPSSQGLRCCPSILGSLPLSVELVGSTPAPSRADRDLNCVAPLFGRKQRGKTKSSNSEKQPPITFLFNIVFS